jgi:hypothetical protein
VYIFRISKGAPELGEVGGSFTQMVARGCPRLFFFLFARLERPIRCLGRNAAADVDDREQNEEDPPVQVDNQDPAPPTCLFHPLRGGEVSPLARFVSACDFLF